MLQEGICVAPIKTKTGCTCDHSVSHMTDIPSSFHTTPVGKERSGLNMLFTIFIYLIIIYYINGFFSSKGLRY